MLLLRADGESRKIFRLELRDRGRDPGERQLLVQLRERLIHGGLAGVNPAELVPAALEINEPERAVLWINAEGVLSHPI